MKELKRTAEHEGARREIRPWEMGAGISATYDAPSSFTPGSDIPERSAKMYAVPSNVVAYYGNEAFRLTVELLNMTTRGCPYSNLPSSTSTGTVSEAFVPRRKARLASLHCEYLNKG